VGLRPVRNLVSHTGPYADGTAVFELGVELALQAQENVALLAPMIGDIFYAPMRLHQFVFLMLHMKL
jgi:hypothetical protein